jgi:hypothetical protein
MMAVTISGRLMMAEEDPGVLCPPVHSAFFPSFLPDATIGVRVKMQHHRALLEPSRP